MADDFFLKIHTFVYQNWQQYRDSTRAFKLQYKSTQITGLIKNTKQ